MPRTVLVVDDSAAFRATARVLLSARGYEVVGVARGRRVRAARRRARCGRTAWCWTSTCPTATGVSVAGGPDRERRPRGRARVHARRVGARRRRRALAARAASCPSPSSRRRGSSSCWDHREPRIVIGEDQALLRQGIVRLLGDAGFEVVAEAGDAPDLLRKVGAHKPDVAIVDVQMPPDNTDDGLRAALEIRASQPDVGVLVLSQYVEERYAVDLIGDNAEGVGYLLKDRVTDFALFADAVRRVAAGGSVLDPTRRRAHVRSPAPRRPARGADAARARGARADGRGPLEQGHRRGARRHPARRREARHEHLQQARRERRRRGPPARARRARVPPRHRREASADERALAGRALDLERAVERADAVDQPAQAGAAAERRAPPTPSSRMSITAAPFSRRTSTRAYVALAYLATLVSASATTK